VEEEETSTHHDGRASLARKSRPSCCAPAPEEKKHTKSAIGAERAKQARGDMPMRGDQMSERASQSGDGDCRLSRVPAGVLDTEGTRPTSMRSMTGRSLRTRIHRQRHPCFRGATRHRGDGDRLRRDDLPLRDGHRDRHVLAESVLVVLGVASRCESYLGRRVAEGRRPVGLSRHSRLRQLLRVFEAYERCTPTR
jgi:hypothetical protein